MRPEMSHESYHLPGGQSDSLALSNMPVRMDGLDIIFGSDTYSRLLANTGAGGVAASSFQACTLLLELAHGRDLKKYKK